MVIGPLTDYGDIPLSEESDSLPHAAVYNVKAYGAVADGAGGTDNTAAFQAAIDAAAEVFGTVLIPPGDYTITGTIQLKRSVSIVGERAQRLAEFSGVTISHEPTVLNTDLFVFDTALGANDDVGEISGLHCTGDATNSRYGFTFVNPRNIILKNSTITSFDTGLYLRGTIVCLVEDCLIELNRTQNVLMGRSTPLSSTTCRFHRCYFRGAQWGVVIGYHCGSILLQSCAIESCTVGGLDIYSNLAYVLILDCYLEDIGPPDVAGNVIQVGVNGPGTDDSRLVIFGGRLEGKSAAYAGSNLISADHAAQISVHGVFCRRADKLITMTGNTTGVTFTSCETENVADISPLVLGDASEIRAGSLLADAATLTAATITTATAPTIIGDRIQQSVTNDRLDIYGGTTAGASLLLFGNTNASASYSYLSSDSVNIRAADADPVFCTMTEAVGAYFNPSKTATFDFRVDGGVTSKLFFVDAGADSVSIGGSLIVSGASITFRDADADPVFFTLTEAAGFDFNPSGTATMDFNVRGDTVGNLFFVDAGADTVNVNGDFSVQSSALFVDASEDAVGIGTNSIANSGDKSITLVAAAAAASGIATNQCVLQAKPATGIPLFTYYDGSEKTIELYEQSHIADPSADAASLKTAVDAILVALENLGLLATS